MWNVFYPTNTYTLSSIGSKGECMKKIIGIALALSLIMVACYTKDHSSNDSILKYTITMPKPPEATGSLCPPSKPLICHKSKACCPLYYPYYSYATTMCYTNAYDAGDHGSYEQCTY